MEDRHLFHPKPEELHWERHYWSLQRARISLFFDHTFPYLYTFGTQQVPKHSVQRKLDFCTGALAHLVGITLGLKILCLSHLPEYGLYFTW